MDNHYKKNVQVRCIFLPAVCLEGGIRGGIRGGSRGDPGCLGGIQGDTDPQGGGFFLRNSTSLGGIQRNRGSAFIILKGVKCILRIWTARFLEFYLPFCICAGSSLAENGPIKRLRETRACLSQTGAGFLLIFLGGHGLPMRKVTPCRACPGGAGAGAGGYSSRKQLAHCRTMLTCTRLLAFLSAAFSVLFTWERFFNVSVNVKRAGGLSLYAPGHD